MSKFQNILWKVIGLGPLAGWKTILATILLFLPKIIPGFPVLDITNGIDAGQIFLALAALQKVLEKFLVKRY